MTHRFALALIAGTTMLASAAPAQTVPEGQSCGGLVCDLGIFGHKTSAETAAKPADSRPAPAVPSRDDGRTAAAPVAGAPEAKVPKVRKPKRVAKAIPAAPVPVAPVPVAPATSIQPATQAPASTPVVAAQRPADTGLATTVRTTTAPSNQEVYIRPNPYTSGLPGATVLLPIGPAPPP